jgi:hypothetical protein
LSTGFRELIQTPPFRHFAFGADRLFPLRYLLAASLEWAPTRSDPEETKLMLFSRWKVMTGLVGVSLGGLAALAGQLPKPEPALPPLPEVKQAAPEPKPVAEAKVPIKQSKERSAEQLQNSLKNQSEWTPIPPHVPISAASGLPPVELPVLPLPSANATPSVAQTPSKTGELPPLPLPEKTGDAPKPVFVTTPGHKVTAPNYTPDYSSVPTSVPPAGVLPTAGAAAPLAPPIAEPDPAPLARPTVPPTSTVYSQGPGTNLPVATPPLPTVQAADPLIAPSKPSVGPAATKFRIVLRVGDGEPSFEVRHGDNLVMKVTCDKVDIKSPEKGQGSNVTATGRVKFVGFGAEGTCDSLSFLAGSGEVALSGNVNVKVRDKIGRVESELNAEKMQYKLDQTALTGVLKP